MPGKRKENPKIKPTPLPLRIAIVTLRFFCPTMTFLEIAKKLDLEERTCQRIYLLATRRACSPNDFRDLLACADERPRPGRAPDPNSRRSRQLARKAARDAQSLAEAPKEPSGESVEGPLVEVTEHLSEGPADQPPGEPPKSLLEIGNRGAARHPGVQTFRLG